MSPPASPTGTSTPPTSASSTPPPITPLPAGTKTVLITGCSEGGIGSSLALAFARSSTPSHPLHIFATARNPSKLAHLDNHPNITTLTLDVTSPSSITSCVSLISKHTTSRLDYLINNAGLGYSMPVLDISLPTARQVFETNFFSIIALTQAFSPLLIASKGTIINIGSIVAELSPPFSAIYNASKAALHSLSDSLRIELMPFDVGVLTVVAGAVASKFSDNRAGVELPLGSLYEPVRKEVEKAHDPEKADDPDEWAGRLVKRVLAGEKRKTWLGTYTGLFWGIRCFLWHGATDSMFGKRVGMNKLREIRRKGEEEKRVGKE